MKKIIVTSFLLGITIAAVAQYEKDEPKKGFKKENFFTGGNVTVSFYNGGTVLGISPYFGYSLNKYLDVAVAANFNYTSQRDYFVYGDKMRQTIYGPGAFVRLYPVKFLFAEARYEHNFIQQKYFPGQNNGFSVPTPKLDANSFLVGGGYCSGRQGTGDMYYYFSVLWDVSKVAQSPYVDGLGRNFPVIKAGLQIPLFQGRGQRR